MNIPRRVGTAARMATVAMGLAVIAAAGAQADPAADLVGPGCADYAALHPDGPAMIDTVLMPPGQ